MPELPEVHRVGSTLAPHVLGRRVAAVKLMRRDIVEGPAAPTNLLVGAVIGRVERHGKQLALVARSGRVLVVQLGMTGQLFFLPEGHSAPRADHIHARWSLERGGRPAGQMLFRDPRRFGGLVTLARPEDLLARWESLGSDALSIRVEDLGAALSRTKRPVKAALLDQSILAGVGNIYADEALFEARVHPLRETHRLTGTELVRLADAITSVLARAVAAGGSTLRDYVDADGQPGGYSGHHAVYGRAGLACLRCSTRLRRLLVAQRTTVHCPTCQPRHPAKGDRETGITAQCFAQGRFAGQT